jgi:PilZ domain
MFTSPSSFEPGGIELSEKRLRELAELLHGDDPVGRRAALRVPVEGFVTIQPLGHGGERSSLRVGVYDLSRSGIAIVAAQPLAPGSKFNVLFTREDAAPIELLCTARHSRRQGDAYITGAEFGVSWLSALGAAVAPPRP